MSRRIAPRRGPSNDPQIEDGVHITDLPIDIFARKIEVTPCGHRRWKALCPCHGDTNASLSISETEGGDLLMMCHGCHATGDRVAEALGLPPKYLFASDYARAHNTRGVVYSSGAKTTAEKIPLYDRMAMVTTCLDMSGLSDWAAHLGVTEESLSLLESGRLGDVLYTPERDYRGRITGFAKREMYSTKKRVVPGSVRGLYIPSRQITTTGPLYIAEGMSDTAALLSAGARVIGRSQALTRDRQLRWLAKWIAHNDNSSAPVIVLGDNDGPSGHDGVGWRGGHECARELKAILTDRVVRWAVPRWERGRVKYKDVRDQIRAGDWSRGLHVHQAGPPDDRAAKSKRRPY